MRTEGGPYPLTPTLFEQTHCWVRWFCNTLWKRSNENWKNTFCSLFYLLIHKLYDDKIMYLSSINDIKYNNLIFTYSTRKMLMGLKYTTVCD